PARAMVLPKAHKTQSTANQSVRASSRSKFVTQIRNLSRLCGGWMAARSLPNNCSGLISRRTSTRTSRTQESPSSCRSAWRPTRPVPPASSTLTDEALGTAISELPPQRLEQLRGFVQGQAHDAAVAAVDVPRPGAGAALDRIGASLAQRLARGHIPLDL